MNEQLGTANPDKSVIRNQEPQERFERRFQYLDNLKKFPNKTFYISGLMPSVFTIDLSKFNRDEDEAKRSYQGACEILVGYLRNIYAELSGHGDIVSKALELHAIDEYSKNRLEAGMLEIDQVIPEHDILDGVDILTGKDTSFFLNLTLLKNPLEWQKEAASIGRELSKLSTVGLSK